MGQSGEEGAAAGHQTSSFGGLGSCLVAVLLAGLGMAVWSWPLLLHPGELLPWDGAGGSPAEAAVHRGVFELWNVGDRLTSGLNPLLTERLFAPHGALTSRGSHALLHGVVGLPLVALFGAPAAYVGLWLGFGLLTCALGFALGRALGLSNALSTGFSLLLTLAPAAFAGAAQGLDACASPFPVLVALGVVRVANRRCGPGAASGALWIGLGLGLALWTGWAALVAALAALGSASFATWRGGAVHLQPAPRSQRATTSPAWLIVIALFGFGLWGVPFRAWMAEAEPPTRFTLSAERGAAGSGGELAAAHAEVAIAEPMGSGPGTGAEVQQQAPAGAEAGSPIGLAPSGLLNRVGVLMGRVIDPRRPGSWLLVSLIPLALWRGRGSRAWIGAALGVLGLAALPWPHELARVAVPTDLAPTALMCLAAGAGVALQGRKWGSRSALTGGWAWALALLLAIEPLAARGRVLRLERPEAIIELAGSSPELGRVLHLPGALGSSPVLSWATLHGRTLLLPFAGPEQLEALREFARRYPELFALAFGREFPDLQGLAFELDVADIDALTLTPGWTAEAEALEELLDGLDGFERVPLGDGRVYLWRRLTRS